MITNLSTTIVLVIAFSRSDDDTFMLAACFHGDSNTLFVTNDTLRQHYNELSKIDPSLATLFTKWQYKHTLRLHRREVNLMVSFQFAIFKTVNFEKIYSFSFQNPIMYETTASNDGKYWYIPMTRNVNYATTMIPPNKFARISLPPDNKA